MLSRPQKKCLQMMWKILTVPISEAIYYLLVYRGLFSEEQKEYRDGTRGIDELIYIFSSS